MMTDPIYNVRIRCKPGRGRTEYQFGLLNEGLQELVVHPYCAGKPIVLDGRIILPSDIERITLMSLSEEEFSKKLGLLERIRYGWIHAPTDHFFQERGTDVTELFITGPPGLEMEDLNTTIQQSRQTTSMRVFISHNSNDVEIATLLIELLRKALRLSSEEIRCTSVDGYRMQAGAPIDDRLRGEVHDTELLIGLITPNSLGSAYVIFELGARWGAEKPMVPLLASGVTPEHLEGPLAGINALDSRDDGQVYQLLEDAAKYLRISLDKVSSYAAEVNELVKLSSEGTTNMQQASRPLYQQLSEDAKELLLDAADSSDDTIMAYKVMAGLGIRTRNRSFVEPGDRRSEARWKRALEELEQKSLIEALSNKREVFQLTHAGFAMADTLNEGQKGIEKASP